jgi:hypothetical protein
MPPNETICRHFAVKARPNRSGEGGYIGSYCIPGKDEQFARDGINRIAVFNTRDEAIAAAGEDMCRALNARHKSTVRHKYRRMSGAELAVTLKQLNLPPMQFAALYGTDGRRVLAWFDGAEDIPHAVNALTTALAIPGVLPMVQRITDMSIITEPREAAHAKMD